MRGPGARGTRTAILVPAPGELSDLPDRRAGGLRPLPQVPQPHAQSSKPGSEALPVVLYLETHGVLLPAEPNADVARARACRATLPRASWAMRKIISWAPAGRQSASGIGSPSSREDLGAGPGSRELQGVTTERLDDRPVPASAWGRSCWSRARISTIASWAHRRSVRHGRPRALRIGLPAPPEPPRR